MEKIIEIKKGELWYSGQIDDTANMPYDGKKVVDFDLDTAEAYNQISPMLISSTGRYLYAPKNFKLHIENGIISVSSKGNIDFGEKENFRKAYEYLKDTYFEFDGRFPDLRLFLCPQYCTWMSLGYNQTQAGVLKVAKNIIDAGLPAGELIIDDNWAPYMGKFEFDAEKFPDPQGMVEDLRDMGFFVSLWVVPYISPDTETFRYFRDNDMLYKQNGKVFLTEWWDGYSACMDFTNPKTVEWVENKFDELRTKFGIDGLKMDGGDNRLYANDLQSFDGVSHTANELSELWGRLAAKFSVSEIRSTNRCEGLPVMQRIADRFHAWEDEKNGFGSIIKRSLIMSIAGYPYNCPDMIGGGQSEDWNAKEDDELNIRYMEAATFLPSFQFSKRIWEHGKNVKDVVLKMVEIRDKYSDDIMDAVLKCAKTGEPIIKSMLFEYGIMPENLDQFVLGDRILVAPVMNKGQTGRKVFLPEGEWETFDGKTVKGGKEITVSAPIDVLPYFIKLG
ncbi:MAG: glycoside hydrolase family 31 protein [Clostridia bacterium]|nr:glycoside hydrolase family 31 protein [Clostridia bacterium]